MFCQKCGTEGVEGEFCKKCGIKLGNMTISQQPQTIYIQQTPEPIKKNDGTASLILGIIGLFAWIIPIAGIIIGTCGARSGVQSNKQNLNGKATTGIILSTISIIASFLWIIIGLMLAGSLWGNPDISPYGIVRNWNTTNNKLIQSVGGNNGVLICLDELSMSKADNTQLTYLLTGGTDKQRMTNDSSANDEFRTIFMSTGEIQFKTSNFGGIGVRLFEIKNYNFTQNKETAEEISKFIANNYGIAGFEFAKVLSGFSSEYICKKIDKYSKIVEKRIKTHTDEAGKAYSPLFSRMADKIAAVALAANIAKNKLKINFNTSAIVDFLICDTTFLEMGQEQSVEAMDKFFEEYSKNKTKFPQITSDDSNIWGKSVVRNRELSEIIVLYNQFVAMMKKVGFPDTASLIKALKEKGFIKCEEDKNYSRRNVGNIKRAKVIAIDVTAVKGGADNEN